MGRRSSSKSHSSSVSSKSHHSNEREKYHHTSSKHSEKSYHKLMVLERSKRAIDHQKNLPQFPSLQMIKFSSDHLMSPNLKAQVQLLVRRVLQGFQKRVQFPNLLMIKISSDPLKSTSLKARVLRLQKRGEKFSSDLWIPLSLKTQVQVLV